MTLSQVVWLVSCCLVSASHKLIHKLKKVYSVVMVTTIDSVNYTKDFNGFNER